MHLPQLSCELSEDVHAILPWLSTASSRVNAIPLSLRMSYNHCDDEGSTSIVVNEMRVLHNNFEGYEVTNKCLGQGGWGKVYAAYRKSDNKQFAMKLFGYTSNAPVIEEVNSEIVLMMALAGIDGKNMLQSRTSLR